MAEKEKSKVISLNNAFNLSIEILETHKKERERYLEEKAKRFSSYEKQDGE